MQTTLYCSRNNESENKTKKDISNQNNETGNKTTKKEISNQNNETENETKNETENETKNKTETETKKDTENETGNEITNQNNETKNENDATDDDANRQMVISCEWMQSMVPTVAHTGCIFASPGALLTNIWTLVCYSMQLSSVICNDFYPFSPRGYLPASARMESV